VFTEPPNAELFAKLTPLLSHDDLYVEVAFTDSSSEGIRTMHVRIQGWPAVFTVFSEDEINRAKQGLVTDPQLFSRFLKIEINNNPQKFKGVIKYEAVQAMAPHVLNSDYEEQLKKAQDYIRYLKDVLTRIKSAYNPISTKYTSINLFAGIMAKNYDARVGEDMRSFRMLLTLMEIRAWLYYDYRLKINDGGRIKVIVHADDVKAILDRFGPQITSHLPKTKISEFETLKQILGNGAKSAEEIFESGALNYSSPRSLRTNLLSLLVKYGYLKAFTDPTDQKHRRLLYAISGFNGMDLMALPSGCHSDAIYAIIKRFLMKWLSVGQVVMAWKMASKGIDNTTDGMQDVDALIREYILGQNDVFHAITPENMKQSMASMASEWHPKVMPLDHAIAQESTNDPIQERFIRRKMVTPDGEEAEVYTCRACGKLFMSREEAERHEC
jgi:bifunctional DNA-binding transcriptional regulator/antitoxin component of YhaV-PrlF toxin-antitoxin module